MQLQQFLTQNNHTYSDLTDIYSTQNQFLEVHTSSRDIFYGISKYIASAKYEVNLTFYNWYTDTDPADVILTALWMAIQGFIPTQENPQFIIRFLFSESIFQKGYVLKELTWGIEKYNLSTPICKIQIFVKRYYGLGSYHFKYVTIDNQICLITGANVQDKSNFIESQNRKVYNWNDIGIILKGNITNIINQHFSNVTGVQIPIIPTPEIFENLPILVLSNPADGTISNKYLDLHKSYNTNLNLGVIYSMLSAKKEINIITPNINDAIIFYTLIDIILQTEVVLNILSSYHFDYISSEHYESGANSNYFYNLIYFNNITYNAYLTKRLNLKWFSYDGKNILQGNGKYANHAKAIFIDDDISIIGSYNLTTQSTLYSGELSVLIQDKFVHDKIKKVAFNKNWEKAIPYQLIY